MNCEAQFSLKEKVFFDTYMLNGSGAKMELKRVIIEDTPKNHKFIERIIRKRIYSSPSSCGGLKCQNMTN